MTLPNPLGPYRIERQLGEGGFTIVYLAFDERRGHAVALKVLRPEHARDEPLRRFQREGQQMLSLRHQHIVSAYDAGQAHGYHYIAMPYLAGGSLADLIRQRGRLDLQTAARVVEQVASALDFVHPNIIHRDLKANNVLLDAHGEAYVSDFGVAHLAGASTLTPTGEQPGTVVCMAPEQIKPSLGPRGPAADVWALGVMLYQMLTGRLPFQHEDPIGVMYQIVHEQPPRASSINRELPPAIDSLLARALDKNPGQRYQRAGDLGRDLRKIAGPGPATVTMFTDESGGSSTPLSPPKGTPQRTDLRFRELTKRRQRLAFLSISAVGTLALILVVVQLLTSAQSSGGLSGRVAGTVTPEVSAALITPDTGTAQPIMTPTSTLRSEVPVGGAASSPVPPDAPPTAPDVVTATSTLRPEVAAQSTTSSPIQPVAKTVVPTPLSPTATRAASPKPTTGVAPAKLAAPELVAPVDGQTASFDAVNFEWKAVPGAKYYRLETRSDREDQKEWRAWGTPKTTSVNLYLAGVPYFRSGTLYYWRVVPVGTVDGPASAERTFRYDTSPAFTSTPVPPTITPTAPPPSTDTPVPPPPDTPVPPPSAPLAVEAPVAPRFSELPAMGSRICGPILTRGVW